MTPPNSSTPRRPPISVLLVERDGDTRDRLNKALLRDGYVVVAVSHPRLALEASAVHQFSAAVVDVALPEVDFRVVCSKGFYVRTYAHDIGRQLGCGGHLSSLRRTKSGRFVADGALTFAELKAGPREKVVERMLSLPEVSKLRGA